jgi:hypothetical protein
MSDSRGEDADIPSYPGEDRPADAGAESRAVPEAGQAAPGGQDEVAPSAADEAALPSEQQGAS